MSISILIGCLHSEHCLLSLLNNIKGENVLKKRPVKKECMPMEIYIYDLDEIQRWTDKNGIWSIGKVIGNVKVQFLISKSKKLESIQLDNNLIGENDVCIKKSVRVYDTVNKKNYGITYYTTYELEYKRICCKKVEYKNVLFNKKEIRNNFKIKMTEIFKIYYPDFLFEDIKKFYDHQKKLKKPLFKFEIQKLGPNDINSSVYEVKDINKVYFFSPLLNIKCECLYYTEKMRINYFNINLTVNLNGCYNFNGGYCLNEGYNLNKDHNLNGGYNLNEDYNIEKENYNNNNGDINLIKPYNNQQCNIILYNNNDDNNKCNVILYNDKKSKKIYIYEGILTIEKKIVGLIRLDQEIK